MDIKENLWLVNEEKYIFGLELVANDQVLKQELEELELEGKVDRCNLGYCLKHSIAAELEIEVREILKLPKIFPYPFRITSEAGNLANRSFKYKLLFMNNSVKPFVNPKILGSYIEIRPDYYFMFIKEQYKIVSEIKKFNEATDIEVQNDVSRFNLIKFASIKELAVAIDAEIEEYLLRENVFVPKKISINLNKINDETLEIEPILLDADSNKIKIVNKEFLGRFEATNKIRDVYSLKTGERIVINDSMKSALKKIKINKKISKELKETIIKSPREVFSEEVFDFENSGFASRVVEIGEYRPRTFTFLRPNKESWLPPECGLLIDGKEIVMNTEKLNKIVKEVKVALEKGMETIAFEGENISINEEFLIGLETLLDANQGTTEEVIKEISEGRSKKNVLIIKDNIDDVYISEVNPRNGIEEIPENLNKKIKMLEHQIEGFHWIQNCWISGLKGALLADDMGLGKTLQTIVFISWIREMMVKEKIQKQPILIVAPVALIKNWQEEIFKFLEDVTFLGEIEELHGGNLKKYICSVNEQKNKVFEKMKLYGKEKSFNIEKINKLGICLTTYETLRDYQIAFGLIDWALIVLHEVQKIKNPTALVTTAVKAMKYDFSLCLTGTPVENSWIDLWSIMDFTQPGKLGSLKEFDKKYQSKLKDIKEESELEKLGNELKGKLAPQFLRRLKKDKLKGLPEKFIRIYQEDMPEEQYDTYVRVIQKTREKENTSKENILTIISKLRDISLHPCINLYGEYGFNSISCDKVIAGSARLIKTFQIIDEIKKLNEKAIIFITSKKMQKIMQNLIEKKYNLSMLSPINGEVLGEKRQRLVDIFNRRDGFQILLLSPEAGGIGLNITSANHVIHLSRTWNPAKEDQATDRAYRIGQTKNVFVHIPLAVHPKLGKDGSFDEKLSNLLQYKRSISDNVLIPNEKEEQEKLKLFDDLVKAVYEDIEMKYWTMDEIDRFSSVNFGKIIKKIFEQMNYIVENTPECNSYGADIIVYPKIVGEKGFLIKYNQAIDIKEHLGMECVEEIHAAINWYRKKLNISFKTLVITNAEGFSKEAEDKAKINEVELKSRKKLIELLQQYPVEKNI